jgi:periplasmic copper chaperone A
MSARHRTSLLRRCLAGGGATLAALAGSVRLAGPASAHVTVNPREAPAGGFAKLTFRVPTESATASTTRLAVSFPTSTPLASVSIKPHPGWTATVTRSKLARPVESGDLKITEAVSRITWTAQGGTKIAPGQFEEFDVSVGPLPEGVKTLSFPALQSYDDGSTVSWNQPVTGGDAEPEHPAPTLTLAADDDGGSAATASTPPGSRPPASAEGSAANPGTSPVAQTQATDGTARALGTAGLVVGALGLLTGAVAVGAARRRGA